MVNMIYAALLMCAQTVKTTSANLYIYNGVGARDLYIDEAHTALDIFRFAAFFFYQRERVLVENPTFLKPFPNTQLNTPAYMIQLYHTCTIVKT